LNQRSKKTAQFALRGVALAVACLWGSQAWALGLGRLSVQSSLGETLRAEIDVTSITPEEAASLRVRVAPPDVYRSSGVEYNAALPSASVQLVQRNGRQVLRVTTERAVLEPFVDLIVEATWASGRLVREYTMLFDPPQSRPVATPPAETAPVLTPAPSSTVPLAPPAATPAPTAAAPRAAAAPAPQPARPAAGAAPASAGGDTVRVARGDSLSRIAGRIAPSGVSLDQMLVSLFRTNPDAFVGENMNRLKAGSVLTVPSADEAGKITPQEAREVIVAQSADFGAYRQRLAQGVGAAPAEAPARQAAGKVQAQVEDRKQGAATTPERLILSQGGVKPGAPEAKISKDAERKDAGTRIAELSRNVDDLKKLQQGTTAPAAPAAPAPPPAAAPAPTPAPAPAPDTASPAPTIVAAAPSPSVATPASAPAPAKAPAPALAAAPAAASVPQADSGGLLDSFTDNTLLLPATGVLVLLLGGLGVYRLRSKFRKSAGETSFLESRLQPDSFFGASGGQRIDTRDAGNSAAGQSSSMSYSLSQLDAIGDVDPVAEADVYLAYGRDLQAEEILKEAMRSTPERMAIRSKLLEVYAKRRDVKGFELLATQMFNLTRGEGEDWAKAQELGRSIDPDNLLYQPGGRPADASGDDSEYDERLGTPTQPRSAPAQPPAFEPAADATLDSIDVDLDIGLGGGDPVRAPEATQPIALDASLDDPFGDDRTSSLEPEPKTAPVKRPSSADIEEFPQTLPPDTRIPSPAPAPTDDGLDFDLGSLREGLPTVAPAESSRNTSLLDFGDFGLEPPAAAADSSADSPLARKLELAEEFRQIGDMEGARDLLEEVVSKADGALKAKAQGMLEKLG
jgi:pilus assembly protein FimV